MPVAWCSRSSRCSRSSASGYSLMEMIVAMAVVLLVAAAAMSVAQSSRRLYNSDGARVAVDQNLGIGMNMLAIDVRQAGERVQGDVPAIEIVNGVSAPDTVIIRRSLLDAVLPLCKTINAGSSADSVFVATKNAHPPAGCTPVGDADHDSWPDNLEEWRNYRLQNGGIVMAYIYDPVTHAGEFFQYDDEDKSTFHIHRASGSWTTDFPVEDGSRVYLLEQRLYRVQTGLLQLVINGNTGSAQNLVSNITNLQAKVRMDDGTVQDTFDSAGNWTRIQAVEILMTGEATFHGITEARSLTTRLFPRNILSR